VAVERERADGVPGLYEERRSWRSSFVGTGSLACPSCDAPALLSERPAGPGSPLECSFCDHRGAVRDYLSFGEPLRAPRVNVFVRL